MAWIGARYGKRGGRETDDQSYDVSVSSWIANVLLLRGYGRGTGGMATEGKGCLGSGWGWLLGIFARLSDVFLLYLEI